MLRASGVSAGATSRLGPPLVVCITCVVSLATGPSAHARPLDGQLSKNLTEQIKARSGSGTHEFHLTKFVHLPLERRGPANPDAESSWGIRTEGGQLLCRENLVLARGRQADEHACRAVGVVARAQEEGAGGLQVVAVNPLGRSLRGWAGGLLESAREGGENVLQALARNTVALASTGAASGPLLAGVLAATGVELEGELGLEALPWLTPVVLAAPLVLARRRASRLATAVREHVGSAENPSPAPELLLQLRQRLGWDRVTLWDVARVLARGDRP